MTFEVTSAGTTASNMEDPFRLDSLHRSKHIVHVRWETANGNGLAFGWGGDPSAGERAAQDVGYCGGTG